MLKRNVVGVAIVLHIFAVMSCGGGGGGPDGSFFGGTWQGSLFVVENTCDWQVENFELNHLVNQAGSNIVIDSLNYPNMIYEGFASETGFRASRGDVVQCVYSDGRPAPGSTAQRTRTMELSEVEGDSGIWTYTMDTGNCSGSGPGDDRCRSMWQGVVTRASLR